MAGPIGRVAPYFWADQVGLQKIRDKLREFALVQGANLELANLLSELADRDGKLLDQSGR